jgi:hypothetical protein
MEKDKMAEQLNCPKCGKSNISKKAVSKVGYLVGGLFLCLLGLFFSVGWYRGYWNALVPAGMGWMMGIPLLYEYRKAKRRKLTEYHCAACYHNWELGANESLELHVESIKNKKAGVRSEAIASLGSIGDARALDSLVSALDDEDVGVRTTAVNALAKLGGAASVGPLLEALRDESISVRNTASLAFNNMKDKRTVEPLLEALQHDDKEIREFAASALGNIGDVRAIDALTETTKDKYPGVRFAAKGALKKIRWRSYVVSKIR